MGSGWARHLLPFLESEEFKQIGRTLKQEMSDGKTLYPLFDDVFKCFHECSWENTHTVFLGANPYIKGQADGILYSCSKSEFASDMPACLNKILDGVEEDYADGLYLDRRANLQRWANQGVLLLPLNLTVIRDNPASHLLLWKPFIEAVIQALNEYSCGVIYVLMGTHAHSLKQYINTEVNDVYELEHPMIAVKEKRKWKHQNIFTKLNSITKFLSYTTVKWTETKI